MFSPAPKPLEHRKSPAVLLMAFIAKDLRMEERGVCRRAGSRSSCSAGFVSGDSSSRVSSGHPHP